MTFRPFRTTLIAPVLVLILSACGGAEPSTNADVEKALNENNYRIAQAHLADIFSDGREDQQTYLLRLAFTLETGDGHGASAAIESLNAETLPEDERRIATAHALILRGQYEAAYTLYEDATLSDLSEQDYRMVLWALREDNQLEPFIAGMDEGLLAYPDSADLNALAGLHLLATGAPEEAQSYADKALQAAPEDYEILLLQGELAIAKDELELALTHYSKARDLYPTRAAPTSNVAGLLLDLGRTEEAGEALKTGIQGFPEDPFMNWQQARYALASGDLEGAREALEVARKTYRDEDEFTLLSAQVEDGIGNHGLAISEYERYLRAVGEDEGVEARLVELRKKTS